GSKVNVGDFFELATQTLEGVLSAHGQSILHRDLKPENMKVKRLPGGRLQIKIVDFGLARLSYGAKKQTEDHRGHILGSIFYMAPEQFLRKPLDGRTDLYSLGCVYYQALSGQRPFQAASVAEVMDLHLKHEVTLLHDLRPDLPSRLCDWVMWLMNSDPGDRPANAQQALDSLRGLAAEGGISEPAVNQVAPATPISSGVGRPATGSVTPRSASSIQPQRPVVLSPAGSIHPVAQPDNGSFEAAPLPRAKSSLAWLYIVSGVVALIGGGIFLYSKMHGGAADALRLLPPDALVDGSIIRWVSGEKMEAWSEPGASISPAKPGDLIMNWHDLSSLAGDAVLSPCVRRKESCPRQLVEQPNELNKKISLLRFEAANCMSHVAGPVNVIDYPFGINVKDKGMTIFLIVRPQITNKEATVLRLQDKSGQQWIQLQAFPNNEYRATASVQPPKGKQIAYMCKISGKTPSVFSLVSLRADPEFKKITLTVRNGADGEKKSSDCPMPPGFTALSEINVSWPNTSFTGDICEVILWPFNMTPDQHAEQALKFAEHYFKHPGSKW
ncbi:MAG: serine/threonine protein kinase, partial [Verrucomicrobia bacterium]|nr:serine/threonine protein kinase [Verrucomicrobiota bacterium]